MLPLLPLLLLRRRPGPQSPPAVARARAHQQRPVAMSLSLRRRFQTPAARRPPPAARPPVPSPPLARPSPPRRRPTRSPVSRIPYRASWFRGFGRKKIASFPPAAAPSAFFRGEGDDDVRYEIRDTGYGIRDAHRGRAGRGGGPRPSRSSQLCLPLSALSALCLLPRSVLQLQPIDRRSAPCIEIELALTVNSFSDMRSHHAGRTGAAPGRRHGHSPSRTTDTVCGPLQSCVCKRARATRRDPDEQRCATTCMPASQGGCVDAMRLSTSLDRSSFCVLCVLCVLGVSGRPAELFVPCTRRRVDYVSLFPCPCPCPCPCPFPAELWVGLPPRGPGWRGTPRPVPPRPIQSNPIQSNPIQAHRRGVSLVAG